MRKSIIVCILLVMICSLAVSVSAATEAKNVSVYATVTNDGTCQVTLTANVHLDQPAEDLTFPLPKKAANITVNGGRARSQVEDGVRQVSLSGFIGRTAGDFTLTFTYTLPNLVITNEAGQLELHLPLLAGFAYPVQAMEFSVTLPGMVTAKPAFSSGYHQANIEKDIYCTTNGATVTGISQVELKDHETLTMSLLVTEQMFPQPKLVAPDFKTVNLLVTVFSLLALVYWALFLRNLPTWPFRCSTPPDGYTAGELGGLLHLQGGNLNMMVFSWAQLGYLQIQLLPNGKVQLEKRMDMGNERSAFEQRWFGKLFGQRSLVDATTVRYAQLYQAVRNGKINLSSFIHPKSGNMQVFRGLAAVAGLFYGVSIAIGLSSGAVLQWLLVIVLGAVALVSSWHIQNWAVNLLVPDRRGLYLALGLCGGWLLMGALAGVFSAGMGLAVGQLVAGLLVALGGRRTPAGRQIMGETLGFRRYLKSVSQQQLWQISQTNPEYFHQMAPYAMALGVDTRFAKQFGKLPVSQCPYISVGADSDLRAIQWCERMRRVHDAMNTRTGDSRWERLLALIQSFIK